MIGHLLHKPEESWGIRTLCSTVSLSTTLPCRKISHFLNHPLLRPLNALICHCKWHSMLLYILSCFHILELSSVLPDRPIKTKLYIVMTLSIEL